VAAGKGGMLGTSLLWIFGKKKSKFIEENIPNINNKINKFFLSLINLKNLGF
jgi:hypothetical protein